MIEGLDPFDAYRDAGRHGPRRSVPAVTDDGRRLQITPGVLRRAGRRVRRFTPAATPQGVRLLLTWSEVERGLEAAGPGGRNDG